MTNITDKNILEIYNILKEEVSSLNKEDSVITEIIPIHYGDHYRNNKELNDTPHRKFTLHTKNKIFSFLVYNDGFVQFAGANILQKEPKQINEWGKNISFKLVVNTFNNDFKTLLSYINTMNQDKNFANYLIQLLESSIIFPNKKIINSLIEEEAKLIKQATKALETLKEFYTKEQTYLDIKNNVPNTNIYKRSIDSTYEIDKQSMASFLTMAQDIIVKESVTNQFKDEKQNNKNINKKLNFR